jgi:hypothetical protein
MRSDQVPTIASFMDFGCAAWAAGFCSAAAGGFGGAFWAWLETGSISASAPDAAILSKLSRFIVYLPLHCRREFLSVRPVQSTQEVATLPRCIGSCQFPPGGLGDSPARPGAPTISTHRASALHLIHIKTSRADMDQSACMKDDQNDAAEYLRKAEEYRERARATDDPRVRSALAAVAREFMRKARELEETSPGVAGIR